MQPETPVRSRDQHILFVSQRNPDPACLSIWEMTEEDPNDESSAEEDLAEGGPAGDSIRHLKEWGIYDETLSEEKLLRRY